MKISFSEVCKLLNRSQSQVVQLVAQHRIPIAGTRRIKSRLAYVYDKDTIIQLKGKVDSDFNKLLGKEK